MIEVGTSENYLAVYRGEMTPEGYRCAVEVACAGLLGLYEPVWFAPGDITRFIRDVDSVIARRRSAARLATVRTSPQLMFTLMPLGANYVLRVQIALPHEGEGLDVESATLYVAVPHASLMMAYREVRHLLPDVPATESDAEGISRTVDLSWDGDNGCWLTLPSLNAERSYLATIMDMVELDCRLAVNGVEDMLRDVAFFPDDLRRFADALHAIERGESSKAALLSAGREFELALSVTRRVPLSMEVRATLHAGEYSYQGEYWGRREEMLMGRFPLGERTPEEARRTMEAWLRGLGGEG